MDVMYPCYSRDHLYYLVREAKRFIESRPEKLLYNVVDKRNGVYQTLKVSWFQIYT